MPRIFISYRRTDSSTFAGRIYDRLVDAFGERNIFKDVDDIPFGVDFRSVLTNEVNKADVLLLIIGKEWLNVADELGNRRLDDPNDFVRIEAEHGLQRGRMLVVPVLVGGARMPTEADLPDSLRELAFRNAAVVRDDPDFRRDITRLIDQIKRFFEEEDVPTVRLRQEAKSTPPAAAPADPFADVLSSTPAAAPPRSTAAAPHRPVAQQTPPPAPQATSGGSRKWVYIIIAIVVIVIMLYACEAIADSMFAYFY